MQAKGNKAVANSGYENFCFTISASLKMLPRRFQYGNFSNFSMTFVKYFMKKQHF